MGKIIGIDLGTTNSEVAIMEAGKPKIIKSSEGDPYFPSIVAITKDGERLVGESAKRQAVTNIEGTVHRIKRKMGTGEKIKLHDKEYSPEQISAFILQKIKNDAEDYIGDHKIAVYDFGGGTFDITLMDVGEGVFEVLSTNGDTKLGGTDMDKVLVEYLLNIFEKENNIQIDKDQKALQRLYEASEEAKKELSSKLQTEINLPYLSVVNNEPKHLELKINRAKFEELIRRTL